jgi:hypothetical protein
MAGGAARARGAEVAGQAWGGAVQGVGQAVGQTLNDILKYRSPEAQAKRAEATLALEDTNDTLAMQKAMRAAGGDPNAALMSLDKAGAIGASTKLRTQMNVERNKGLDTHIKELTVQKDNFEQATKLIGSVPEADPKDPDSLAKASEVYKSIVPQLRGLLSGPVDPATGKPTPGVGASIPDEYNPDTVQKMRTLGMSVTEALSYRKEAAAEARAALTGATTKAELIDKMTTSTANYLRTVDNPAEWAKTLAGVKQLVPPDVADAIIGRFDQTFDPKVSPQKAAVLLEKPKETTYEPKNVIATVAGKRVLLSAGFDKEKNQWFAPDAPGVPLKNVVEFVKGPEGQLTTADRSELTKAVQDNPHIWNQLTETARTQIAGDLHKAGFKFPMIDHGASVAAAERWKMGALKALDTEYGTKRGLKGPFGMTQAQYDAKKAEILTSYNLQIGSQGQPPPKPAAPPPAPAQPAPPAAPAAAAPVAPVPPPAPAAPAAPAKPATTAPAAGEVPLHLPSGNIAWFKDQAALDAFLKKHNLTVKK